MGDREEAQQFRERGAARQRDPLQQKVISNVASAEKNSLSVALFRTRNYLPPPVLTLSN